MLGFAAGLNYQPVSSRGHATQVMVLMPRVRWISLLALLTTMAVLAAACSSSVSVPSVLADPSDLSHAAEFGSPTQSPTNDSVATGSGPLGTASSSNPGPTGSPTTVPAVDDAATCRELDPSLALVGQARLPAACDGVDNELLRQRREATPGETISTSNAPIAVTTADPAAPWFASFRAPSKDRSPPSPYDEDGYENEFETWYLDELDAETLWNDDGWFHWWVRFSTFSIGYLRVPAWLKAEVIVAVIDTGTTEHGDFADKFVGSDGIQEFAWIDEPCHRTDSYGHGTEVASLIAAEPRNEYGIAGVAPRARILPIHVVDWLFEADTEACEGPSGEKLKYDEAVIMAISRGADVINLSILSGWYGEYQIGSAMGSARLIHEDLFGTMDQLEIAIRLARQAGIIVVAAVNNCGDPDEIPNSTCPQQDFVDKRNFPAAYPGVIGVGSIDSSGYRANFSSSNEDVDIVAPGDNILTIKQEVPEGLILGPVMGNSYATALVSGVIAHMKARYPKASISAIEDALYSTARRPSGLPNRYPNSSGKSIEYGWGVIQPVDAIEKLGELMRQRSLQASTDSISGEWSPVLAAGVSAQGSRSSDGEECKSRQCRHLHVVLQGAPSGHYTIECWSSLSNEAWGTDVWLWPTSTLWRKGGCWFGFPEEQVWVRVTDAHGTARNSNIITWPHTPPEG